MYLVKIQDCEALEPLLTRHWFLLTAFMKVLRYKADKQEVFPYVPLTWYVCHHPLSLWARSARTLYSIEKTSWRKNYRYDQSDYQQEWDAEWDRRRTSAPD